MRILLLFSLSIVAVLGAAEGKRPNILIAISDDQSYMHTSINGYPAVSTPAFDRIAREGVWCRNAYAGSPGCSPSRAALLTGRHTWQIEHAGTHASEFPAKYICFTETLEQAGYAISMTGKGWGPGNWKVSGRTRNPAGESSGNAKTNPPAKGISSTDYATNFKTFLAQRKKDQPFCFWYGGHEPHRGFEAGSGLKAGKRLADATVPPFLPDTPEIRSDLLDYCLEIEWFDQHLAQMIAILEAAGELDNTVIIVTADNGMAFPRAKANCYDYGIHVPLAIRWGARIPGGRQLDDPVGFVDLTATILDACNVQHPNPELPLSGKSLMSTLTGSDSGLIDKVRTVFSARERHSSSRYNNWTYPQRAMRSGHYLLIRNFRPERWPAGDPVVMNKDGKLMKPHSGYCDIDKCPSLTFLIDNIENPTIGPFFDLAVAKRPAWELFDVHSDPGCVNNLIGNPAHAEAESRLKKQLEAELVRTADPRQLDGGEIWETYKRYSPIRSFPKPE